MEHLPEFLQTCCIRGDDRRIETSLLFSFFNKFLQDKYPSDYKDFTCNLFTTRVKVQLKTLAIPGNPTRDIEYRRGWKSNAIVGLTVNETYRDEMNTIATDRKAERKAFAKKLYARKVKDPQAENRKTAKSKEFKKEFFKRTNWQLGNRHAVDRYENQVDKNLIIIARKDDGSINWNRTVSESIKAITKYEETPRENHEAPLIERLDDGTIVSDKTVGESSEPEQPLSGRGRNEPARETLSSIERLNNQVLDIEVRPIEVSNSTVKDFLTSRDRTGECLARSIPKIPEALTLEEFDEFRYTRYILEGQRLRSLPGYNGDETITEKGKLINDQITILGDFWEEAVDESGYYDFDHVLYFRDQECLETILNLDMLRKFTNYEELKQKLT